MLRAVCLVTFLAGATAGAWGADTARLDIESRIQYAYYTEDTHALQSLADSLNAETKADALHGYYVGLASYRLALLAAERAPDRAKSLLERCAAGLEDSLKIQSDSAEALALESACLNRLSGLKPLGAPLSGLRSNTQMRRALELAPKNPRVLLLDAVELYERAAGSGAGKDNARSKLQQAVAAFEVEREGPEPVPGWGAAEAYTFLARSYLDSGDAIAARGALEHALLMAPDFALAHRLLRRITEG